MLNRATIIKTSLLCWIFILLDLTFLSYFCNWFVDHRTVTHLLEDVNGGAPSSSFMTEGHLSMKTCLNNETSEMRLELFRKKLKEYADFHRDQIELVQNGTIPASKVPTLTWSCSDNTFCSGVGDQFYRIEVVLLLAMVSNRVFGIQWDSVSMKTMKYLKPHTIRWDLVHGNRGITLDQRTLKGNKSDLSGDNVKMKTYAGVQDDEAPERTISDLMNAVYSKDYVHITLSRQVYVPIDVGIKLILKWDKKAPGLFQKIGLLQQSNFNFNLLQHVLLQYLFTFQDQLYDTVNQIQRRIGLPESYLGIHLRTAFVGNEYQETQSQFHPFKVIRDESLWKKILKCSVKRADSLIGINSKLYLATDSYKVKEMAKQMYPDRIITPDIKLQHVIMVKTNGNPKLPNKSYLKRSYQKHNEQFDPNMGTWIDFILLSRSYAIVHPPYSAYSNAAKNWHFIPKLRVFHTPDCDHMDIIRIV